MAVSVAYWSKLFSFIQVFNILVCCLAWNVLPASAKHFPYGTKTSYNDSFSYYERVQRDVDVLLRPSFCQPVFVDVLLRHGIRNPGQKDIHATNVFHQVLQQQEISSSIPVNILRWKPQFALAEHKDIAEQGRIEQGSIGYRMGSRFREILQRARKEDILFMSTGFNRTLESFGAFMDALEKMNYPVSTTCVIDNDLFRFFDTCDAYLSYIQTRSYTEETESFKATLHFREMFSSFFHRLGVSDSDYVSPDLLKSLYVVGATEKAVVGSSPWLELFSEDDLKTLEYLSDLRSYWKRSYGNVVNYEMSCVLLQDVLNRMEMVVKEDDSAKKAVFKFAHAETVLPLLSLLGLFKDKMPLKGRNFEQQKKRQFRTSKISPFSSNLAFVLYECDSDQEDDNEESDYKGLKMPKEWDEYMVQVFFKEIPIQLPYCDYDFCSYKKMKKYIKKLIKDCDLSKICSTDHDEL